MSSEIQQQESTESQSNEVSSQNQSNFDKLREQQAVIKNINNQSKQSEDSRERSRIIGRVKWFNVKNGYGFITRLDTYEDIFVHYTAISMKNPNHEIKSLADGEYVEFNLLATNVTGINGAAVKGNSYMSHIPRRSDRYAAGDPPIRYIPIISRRPISRPTGSYVSRIPRWTGNFRSYMAPW